MAQHRLGRCRRVLPLGHQRARHGLRRGGDCPPRRRIKHYAPPSYRECASGRDDSRRPLLQDFDTLANSGRVGCAPPPAPVDHTGSAWRGAPARKCGPSRTPPASGDQRLSGRLRRTLGLILVRARGGRQSPPSVPRGDRRAGPALPPALLMLPASAGREWILSAFLRGAFAPSLPPRGTRSNRSTCFSGLECPSRAGGQACRTRVIVPAPNVAVRWEVRSERPHRGTVRPHSALDGRTARQRTGSDRVRYPECAVASVADGAEMSSWLGFIRPAVRTARSSLSTNIVTTRPRWNSSSRFTGIARRRCTLGWTGGYTR